MRYIVKADLKKGREEMLKKTFEDGSLGKGSVAGDEYIRDMQDARLLDKNIAVWIEVCFCSTPLAEETPNWEEYFNLIQVSDAVNRKACKHENGKDYWSCIGCRCTEKRKMN